MSGTTSNNSVTLQELGSSKVSRRLLRVASIRAHGGLLFDVCHEDAAPTIGVSFPELEII